MAEFRSALVRTLTERGFVKDVTDLEGLDALAAKGPISAYIGFDATAPALHVGSLIQLMVLRHLKTTGNRPFGLIGHATTLVGDPSDKDAARPMLDAGEIARNAVGIQDSLDRIVGLVRMDDNLVWFKNLDFLGFLRKFGPHFTVNRMLQMDSVKRRLDRERPLSVLEFNYMMMQSIDFLEMFDRHNVKLQIGGSDQWSNIIGGVELVRRIKGAKVFGIVTTLMTDTAGRKMGKTAGGQTIWLDPERTSPFDFWQFWRNVEDAKVEEFLGLFTDLPMDEVHRLGALRGAEINQAKRILATEVTAIVHGRAAATDAEKAAAAIFDKTASEASIPTLSSPKVDPSRPMSFVDLLIHAGFSQSKAAARRLAEQGGVKVNGIPLSDATTPVAPAHFRDGTLRLSAGKKRHVRILLTKTKKINPINFVSEENL